LAEAGNDKNEDPSASAAASEEAVESSEPESDDGDEAEEINPNIAKVAVGASYDSFKDFQVSRLQFRPVGDVLYMNRRRIVFNAYEYTVRFGTP
jgi:hypothetical protein